jgi:predicted ribosomally synthesized peptide with SipW-like signal peptide
LKKKAIFMISFVVLTLALISGGTYAWFSAQDRAKLKNNSNGVQGGLAAGWVDVDLEVESLAYELVQAGSPTPAPTLLSSEKVVLAYPGGTIIADQNGNIIRSNSQLGFDSVLRYTVTNRSKADVLARINHAGVTLNNNNVLTAALNNAVQSAEGFEYKLLGAGIAEQNPSDLTTNGYADLQAFVDNGPTWFYYAPGIGSATALTQSWQYLNMDKLLAHTTMPACAFDVNYKATGLVSNIWNGAGSQNTAGTPLYADPTPQTFSSSSNGIKLACNIDPTLGIPGKTEDDCKVLSTANNVYMYMPASGKVVFEYRMSLDKSIFNNANPDEFSNQYQMAVLAMKIMENGALSDNLMVQGIEPVNGAYDAIFAFGEGSVSATVKAALQTNGLLPTP